MITSIHARRAKTLVKGVSAFLVLFVLLVSVGQAQPTTSERLTIQAGIDKHAFLKNASFPWAHNAYNSHAYEYIEHNQDLSIEEFLDAGVRLIDLDLQWYDAFGISGYIRMCHGMCSPFDARFLTRLEDIEDWLEDTSYPERLENDVIMIYLEAPDTDMCPLFLGCQFDTAVAEIEASIGDHVYKPASHCQGLGSLATSTTKADVLAAGKNIILIGAESDTCNKGNAGNTWGDWVYKIEVAEVDVIGLTNYPSCSGGGISDHPFSTSYNDILYGHEPGGYPLETWNSGIMKELIECGVNAISHEEFEVDDSYHQAHVWSWKGSEPDQSGDCAFIAPSGMYDYGCNSNVRYACKNMSNRAWRITSTYGPWARGAQTCYEKFGTDYEFAVPANGYEKRKLMDANPSGYSLWLNYNDRDGEGESAGAGEGDWEPLQQLTEAVFEFDYGLDGKRNRTTEIPMTFSGGTVSFSQGYKANSIAVDFGAHSNPKLQGDWEQEFGDTFTISAWFKGESSATANNQRLVEFSENGHYSTGTRVIVKSDGRLEALCTDASDASAHGFIVTAASTDYMDDEWHHVAYVNSPDGVRLYVDGVEEGYTSDYCSDVVDAKKLTIGSYYALSGFHFRGHIDDVVIYGVALSEDDVMDLSGAVTVTWHNHNQYSTMQLLNVSDKREVEISIPRTEFLSLAEVQVIDENGNNVALGRPTIQSSTINGGVGSRAVDGNTSGVWGHGSVTHTAKEANPWWKVILPGGLTIREIRIYNRTDCCTSRLNDAVVTMY